MFKDYHKYLSTSLRVYLFVLVIVFILKIVGLDYFGLDTSNKIVNFIDIFLTKTNLKIFTYFIGIMIYQYLMISIMCKDNSKKLKLFTFYSIPFTFIVQYIKLIYNNNPITYIIEFVYLIVICKVYDNQVKIMDIVKILIIIFILQFISNFTRNKSDIQYETTYVKNLILNLDYFVMLLIYQNIELKGGKLCQDTVGLFLQMKTNLKHLQKRLHQNLLNFKKLNKQDKIALIIYFLLSLIWNTLSVLFVLLVANLNHTFIECIFILTSFWLSKGAFGKPFHLSSMIHCFIVSNLSYYILNRITTPLGISILIPIMLGVGLSYVTSKLVKKTYKPLYRGMPEDLFNETILKLVDEDSDKYKICYDFYINKESDLSLSFKYKYSVAGIRKIKDRINEKIKGLNQ